MPKIKLTKSVIDALPPGAKRENYWDAKVIGFGLRVSGDERIYVLKYRVGKRQRWFRIRAPRIALDARVGAR